MESPHMSIPHPASLFDRELEWADLARFVEANSAGPRLGIVYGRRRQGKSFMLEALIRAFGGFYFQALEETRATALANVATALSAFAGNVSVPTGAFPDWPSAIRAIADQAAGKPIVIDEFPYLSRESPELASAIQAAFDGARSGRHPAFRLILCGSSLSVMTGLLTGQQALRGRAILDLPVHALDFRQARSFWEIDDLESAFLVNAVVGGPPGYRDLLDRVTPASASEFEQWLTDGVLNPSHALFREAEYLLAEDPSLVDRALYRSIIAVITRGESTRRGVANRLAKPETALDHALGQLERTGFIVRDPDLLRSNRPLLRVADPLLRFNFVVLRPDLARFEGRQTHKAWQAAGGRFRSQILGPHFESLARAWTASYASAATLGGGPLRVGFVQVNDPDARQAFELDVVAESEQSSPSHRILLAVGEAKGGDLPRTTLDLARLDRLRSLLAGRADVSKTRLLLFGKSGFDDELRSEARKRPDLELIDLERLYLGT